MVSQLYTPTLREADVTGLRNQVLGDVLSPGDDGYETARTVWNAMIDKRPALIIRCAGAADVMASVAFARDNDVPVAIRGGGHNVAGKAVIDDGLMIDLSPMKGVWVDRDGRSAQAQPGVKWTELDHETQAFGLATPGGTVSATGIAGLTLGGGIGWLSGKFGLAVDNLRSVDIVTADGKMRHASETENEDLFWGVRGAGANLGVVTALEFQLHPVGPTILGGMVVHPFSQAKETLRFYRDFVAGQPDEQTTNAGILTMPDGNQVIALVTCYAGDIEHGERVVAPLRQFGSPVVDTIGPMPYVELQSMLDASFPDGRQNYWKANMLSGVSDDLIDTVVQYARVVPSPDTIILFQDFHGRASRVDPSAMAFSHRDATHDFAILSNWADPAETDRNVRWTREFFQALQPHFGKRVYVNALDHDDHSDRVRDAYGENYDRLVEIKTRYDPGNLFRANQNVAPAG